jgi:hypothetical protein
MAPVLPVVDVIAGARIIIIVVPAPIRAAAIAAIIGVPVGIADRYTAISPAITIPVRGTAGETETSGKRETGNRKFER